MNNLRTSPQVPAKPPPYFFMVHLLHRLYGVDAPGVVDCLPCWILRAVVLLLQDMVC